MGSHTDYSKDLFKQLEEVCAKMDSMEKTHAVQINELETKVDKLTTELSDANNKIDSLTVENTILKEDNERLKRILNNNSDNSSLPPSVGGGSGKAANMFNGRKKTNKKHGAQKGHTVRNLSKADIEEKIARNEMKLNEKKSLLESHQINI